MKFFKFVFYSVVILFTTNLNASHIAGGYLRYEHLGDNLYEFTMYIYRDANCDNCAPFDDPAEIAIYSVDSSGTTGQGDTYRELTVPLSRPATDILNTMANCLDGTRIQLGIYKFTVNLSRLTNQNRISQYDVIYQRCCRGALVSNIDQPEQTGFTIRQRITTEVAEPLANASPELTNYDIFSVCARTDFVLDLRHSESEGDSLVYLLDTPLRGGGPLGTNINPGNPMLCDGVNPSPPCPGPFDTVDYVGEGVDKDNPILNAESFALNPTTGQLTGTVNEQGIYLIGYKVLEYRRDSLISETQGQFNLQVAIPVATTATVAVDQWNIFPNPATGEVTINWQDLSVEEVTISDLSGKIVAAVDLTTTTQTSLNTTGWQRGVYFVTLMTKDGVGVRKLVVQ